MNSFNSLQKGRISHIRFSVFAQTVGRTHALPFLYKFFRQRNIFRTETCPSDIVYQTTRVSFHSTPYPQQRYRPLPVCEVRHVGRSGGATCIRTARNLSDTRSTVLAMDLIRSSTTDYLFLTFNIRPVGPKVPLTTFSHIRNSFPLFKTLPQFISY